MCHNNINSDDAIKREKKKKVGAIPVKGAQWDQREGFFVFFVFNFQSIWEGQCMLMNSSSLMIQCIDARQHPLSLDN